MMDGFSLTRVKDAALEKALVLLLRPKLARYGELQRVRLDTTARIISAEFWLLGEPLPIEIMQACYRLGDGAEACELTFHDVKVSRPWLQNLIDDRAPTFTVPLPAYVRPLL